MDISATNPYKSKINLILEQEELTHGAHISTELKFMYMDIPKCGCTTIKYLIQSANFYYKNQYVRDFDSALIHYDSPFIRLKDFTTEAQSEILFEDSFYRFCFVRNPYTRILSCYLTGIVNALPRKPSVYNYLMGKSIDLNSIDKLSSYHITFGEFLSVLKTQRPNEMDIHWRPQYDLLASKFIKYDFIGRFENLIDDIELVRKKLFPTLATKTPPALWPTNPTSRFDEFYTDECIQLVSEIYKNDFIEFGYNPNELPINQFIKEEN